MMSQTTLPKSFWGYALETDARILNMVPTKKVDKAPYEIWHGQAPKLFYLKIWGYEAFIKRDTLTKPNKVDPRSFKCIFIGYPKETMGYSFYSPLENKVFVARNVEFFESKLLYLKASGSVEDLELIQEEDTNPSVDTSLNHKEDDQEIDEPQSDINPIRKSSRTRRAPDRMCLYIDAEEHELGDLIELPPNARTIGSKWLFKKKTNMDGAIYIFKARLVAKGFTQTYGVDYEETFSPVTNIRAIRILIAIATYYDYEIWQIYVKTAFLNGHLSEEVYMEQPEGLLIQNILTISFAMKDLGDVAYILGIKIYRDRSKRLIGLCQRAYIEKILKRYYMENSKRRTILMQEKLKLSKSQGASTPAEKQRMQNIPYASAVGSIMYAMRCNMERELRVSCYTDAGYLMDADNLKSQTGYVFVLNGGVVDWKSTKQSIFATSSTDAEYIVAFDASKEVVWIRKFICGLGIIPTIEEPISMYCDNTGAIAIAKDDGVTKGARHFRAKVHNLRETIKLGDVKIENIDTNDNLVDPFTKALAFPKHFKLTRNIRLLPTSSFM
uniref:Retrotransposon protein, putative, Ty1-copia subclass n=1 Tax=Tanacetum cinerariifolium TaxID=118510 RepID=A0A699HWW1_TANCI|nr:retrotransposon protein, putative, Ty1-copia subclass [Tanacetum cinerariifolium]